MSPILIRCLSTVIPYEDKEKAYRLAELLWKEIEREIRYCESKEEIIAQLEKFFGV